MAKLFGLTAEQQQRLARVADKVEGQPIQRANQQSGTSKPSPSFWVELTEEDPDNPGRYAWKLVDYVDHEWTDRSPEIASPEGEYSAIEANSGSGMVGQRVELHFRGYDAAGKPQYLFGQTALPFMAMIWDHGPDDAADYPVTDSRRRYWAVPIGVRQISVLPPLTPDSSFLSLKPDGPPVTVTNLAERRVLGQYELDDFPVNNLGRERGATLKMLEKGRIIRVWTEIDDEGVPHYVCNETAHVHCWVVITGPATGDWAGKTGAYEGSLGRPGHSTASPIVQTPAGGITGSSLGGGSINSVLVINLQELLGSHVPGPALNGHSRSTMGFLWGWTDEDPPRRVVIVDVTAACAAVEMTTTQTADAFYTTTEQDMLNALKADVQAIITALTDAHLMRNA